MPPVYRYSREAMGSLSMDDRFTMANMAIEAGTKNGIFEVDDITLEYVKEHSDKEYKVYKADDDAEYKEVYHIACHRYACRCLSSPA